MKQVIVIPIGAFNALVKMYAESQSEYQTLKNGLILRTGGGGEEVHIPCDSDRAKTILILAGRVCSEAVPYIKAMNLPDRL